MALLESLQNPALYDHPVSSFQVIETHVSWVLLTGLYAYKIKKPVNYGFLDYSTLEKRRLFCEEEVRLNCRLAPSLYLGVVAICGDEFHPVLNGNGAVFEYAVKMKQFPQETQLDRLLKHEGLNREVVFKLASKIADFHQSIRSADTKSSFGDVDHITQPVMENFTQIRQHLRNDRILSKLDFLETWTHQHLQMLAEIMEQRKKEGFIRECHGDMHLRNIAWWNREIVIFDCIEFNKNFYWIDVISEIAFLIMDLEDRKQDVLARLFLNRYLEITGDYDGVRLLRFYKVYRAMVRAKVGAIRLSQEKELSEEYEDTLEEVKQYVQLACHYIHSQAPCLLINYGVSGSGKSYNTQLLLEKLPAIQVRSDVERKRLFAEHSAQSKGTAYETSIYSKVASLQTYQRLLKIAQSLLHSGYSVIVDAANLKSETRQQFIELASLMCVPFYILAYTAPEKIIRERVLQRSEQGDDVSDATLEILEHQLNDMEPLSEEELRYAITIDTERNIDLDALVDRIVEIRN